jgi:HSP20 family molecular chaperone IbpA
MERDVEELMGRFFSDEEFWGLPEKVFAPHVDVAETDKGYGVKMDLPGIDPKDLTVEIRDGSLRVSGAAEGGDRGEEQDLPSGGTALRCIPSRDPVRTARQSAEGRGQVL